MAQTTQRGMPTSYVKKDGTTFQYCGSGAPVVGSHIDGFDPRTRTRRTVSRQKRFASS